MNQITPYLNFNGRCREAFAFYAHCLGATTEIQTVAESPIAEQFPDSMQDQVVHAVLTGKNGILLMGSDMCCPEGWIAGNNFSLSYSCTEDEIHQLFEQLSEGGSVTEPVQRQFWGDLFGNLKDKFGVRWALNAAANASKPKFETMHFSVQISAPREKVWEVLLEDHYYRQWTAAFHPGSFAEGDWSEGGTVYFKTPEGDGMVSKVLAHQPGTIISFVHESVLHNNEEVPDHPQSERWRGAREIYRAENNGDGTQLSIEVDVIDEYKKHMESSWQKALQIVRSLAETAAVPA
ncbi:VOC family protein [Pseudocnuella soli]|uniref:VOC family protein n=1 Tax=Pseudocnuella soli TaxID=2502779 RepID=UPI001049644F|nr:VOC family protein [Pseudocnuella soli]